MIVNGNPTLEIGRPNVNLQPVFRKIGLVVILAILLFGAVTTFVAIRGTLWRTSVQTEIVRIIDCANSLDCNTDTIAGSDRLLGFSEGEIESIDFSNPVKIIVNTTSDKFYMFCIESSTSEELLTFDTIRTGRFLDESRTVFEWD